jgi:mycothione reductase
MVKNFDLIVIGSGSGLDVANGAARNGLKVAIIESGPLGGTCLNRGCIPSKMLLHVADLVETVRSSHKFSVDAYNISVNFPKIVKEVSDFVDDESSGIEKYLYSAKNPTLFRGIAEFTDHKELRVGNTLIRGGKILIAAGARPKIPEIPGLIGAGYLTSTEALRLSSLPESLVIIGGGYIAVELAHFFGSLGSKVTLIQRSDRLLTREDEEISRSFTAEFAKKHRVLLSSEPEMITKKEGVYHVNVKSSVEENNTTVRAKELLIAVGVTPNTDLLEPERTGVILDERGFIVVDEYLETNVKGIFALGDVIGKYMLKHSANLEAQYSYYNIIDSDNKISVNYNVIPHAVFTSPQIAGVGLSEREAKTMGLDFVVGKYRYIDTGMGMALKDESGFVKILVEKASHKILGCHIMGIDASTLLHEVVVAMNAGNGNLENITGTVHVHPALSEVVLRAALSAREVLQR